VPPCLQTALQQLALQGLWMWWLAVSCFEF
jgi:hypothetical protein